MDSDMTDSVCLQAVPLPMANVSHLQLDSNTFSGNTQQGCHEISLMKFMDNSGHFKDLF